MGDLDRPGLYVSGSGGLARTLAAENTQGAVPRRMWPGMKAAHGARAAECRREGGAGRHVPQGGSAQRQETPASRHGPTRTTTPGVPRPEQ